MKTEYTNQLQRDMLDELGALPTPSSTVDLEREAEKVYPYDNWAADANIGTKVAQRYNMFQDRRREGYIKGRQTTSQKGLEELREWLRLRSWGFEQPCESGRSEIDPVEILNKINELLTKK